MHGKRADGSEESLSHQQKIYSDRGEHSGRPGPEELSKKLGCVKMSREKGWRLMELLVSWREVILEEDYLAELEVF